MADKLTFQQFGQKIKAQHPEYGDIEDAALGQKVLAKYPQYADMVASPGIDIEQTKRNIDSPQGGKDYSPFHKSTPLGAAGTFLKNLAGMGVGIASAPFQNPAFIPAQMGVDAAMAVGQTDPRSGPIEKTAMGVGGSVGINTPALANAAANRDALGMIAEAGPSLAVAGAAGPIGRKLSAGAEARSAPIPKETAVNNVTRALDANIKENPGIRNLLDDQIDTIARGGTIKSKADLLNVIKDAASRDSYRKTFIQPNADLEASAPMNYRGGTATNFSPVNRTATISQLDARLSQINDTLNPKFNRGGSGSTSAQAAIGAEDAAALNAEASAIRDAIAGAVGKKMGVDPNIVYSARKNWSQLNSLAEDVQASVDRNNRIGEGSVPHPSKAGIVSKLIEEVYAKPKANRLVRGTFDRYSPAPEQAVEFNPQPPPLPSQRVPLWKSSAEQIEAIKQSLANQRSKR